MIYLLRLFRRSFLPAPDSAYRRLSSQRLLVMALFWPLFLLLLVSNRLCLWLDTLLFPGFRHLAIVEPLFVAGIPRSGTTFLHRLLAGDQQRFTTMTLWEVLFAPSILQRRFWLTLAKLDRRLGAPLATLLHWLERKALGGLDGVHKTGLGEAEEDYLALANYLGCFLLILPFGDSSLWQLAYLDRDAPAAEKQRLLGHYRALVQRHLYVHGADRTFLSKNPSFTPWLHSLAEAFPDARFIACLRTPLEAVPSQISSILIGARIFSGNPDERWWREGLTDMLVHYYQQVLTLEQQWPAERYQIVRMPELAGDPAYTLTRLYQQFSLPVSTDYADWLAAQTVKARQYRSGHHYHTSKLGLDETQLRQRFAFAMAAAGAAADQNVATVLSRTD